MFECLLGCVFTRWRLGIVLADPTFVIEISTVRQQEARSTFKQSPRFPALPHVLHEAVDLMQQLLYEPEDRLGSQSPSRFQR